MWLESFAPLVGWVRPSLYQSMGHWLCDIIGMWGQAFSLSVHGTLAMWLESFAPLEGWVRPLSSLSFRRIKPHNSEPGKPLAWLSSGYWHCCTCLFSGLDLIQKFDIIITPNVYLPLSSRWQITCSVIWVMHSCTLELSRGLLSSTPEQTSGNAIPCAQSKLFCKCKYIPIICTIGILGHIS